MRVMMRGRFRGSLNIIFQATHVANETYPRRRGEKMLYKGHTNWLIIIPTPYGTQA